MRLPTLLQHLDRLRFGSSSISVKLCEGLDQAGERPQFCKVCDCQSCLRLAILVAFSSALRGYEATRNGKRSEVRTTSHPSDWHGTSDAPALLTTGSRLFTISGKTSYGFRQKRLITINHWASEMDPIIVIGSGLSGLAFAQSLHKSSIPFKMNERGLSRDLRSQGYRICLHGGGVDALRSALTDEVWNLFEDTCPETILGPLPNINALICEATAATFGESKPQGKIIQTEKPYTVDRAVLRQVLLTGLEGRITYGKEYTHFELTDSGIIACFADGTRETGSLLVGADSIHLAVRRQHLPHFRILDTKSRPIFGKTPLTASFQIRMSPKAMECLSIIKDQQTGSPTLMEVIRFLPKDQMRDKRDLPNDYVYWVTLAFGSHAALPDKQFDRLSKEAAAE